MKKTIVMIILFAFVLMGPSLTLAEGTEVSSVKVTENLYKMNGTSGGNIAFLVTEKGVIVVDSGYFPKDGESTIKAIKEITDKPIKYLILTHMHSDHTNGAAGFPENITIIGHENLKGNILKFNKQRLENDVNKTYPESIKKLKNKLEVLKKEKSSDVAATEKKLNELVSAFKQVKMTKIRVPDVVFSDEKTMTLGKEVVVLKYMGNAHTSDNIVVLFRNHNAIHTGDLIFNGIFPYLIPEHGANSSGWIKALDDLDEMNFRIVIPGHGDITDDSVFSKQADYFRELRKQIRVLKKKGFDIEEIQKRIKIKGLEHMKGSQFQNNIKVITNEMNENI